MCLRRLLPFEEDVPGHSSRRISNGIFDEPDDLRLQAPLALLWPLAVGIVPRGGDCAALQQDPVRDGEVGQGRRCAANGAGSVSILALGDRDVPVGRPFPRPNERGELQVRPGGSPVASRQSIPLRTSLGDQAVLNASRTRER
jgi:hypothetical protein